MLNFIFGLNMLDSIILIVWAVLFLLSIGMVIKAKSKALSFGLFAFMFIAAAQMLFMVFGQQLAQMAASASNHNLYLILSIAIYALAVLDIIVAIFYAFPKTNLYRPVWIVFVILNIFAVAGSNILTITSLLAIFGIAGMDAMSASQLFITINIYATYARLGITLIAFVVLLFAKGRTSQETTTDLIEEEPSAATQTVPSEEELTTQAQPNFAPIQNNVAKTNEEPTLSQETSQPQNKEDLPVADTTNFAATSQQAVSEEKYCKSCGYSEKTDKTTCPRCFNTLYVLKECPICHNKSTGNFCGRCGTKLK